MDAFSQLFGRQFTRNVRPEDEKKATALLQVVCKSTASLGDVVTLANELGLRLHFVAESLPKDPEPETTTPAPAPEKVTPNE